MKSALIWHMPCTKFALQSVRRSTHPVGAGLRIGAGKKTGDGAMTGTGLKTGAGFNTGMATLQAAFPKLLPRQRRKDPEATANVALQPLTLESCHTTFCPSHLASKLTPLSTPVANESDIVLQEIELTHPLVLPEEIMFNTVRVAKHGSVILMLVQVDDTKQRVDGIVCTGAGHGAIVHC
jgi:hypothetical protein